MAYERLLLVFIRTHIDWKSAFLKGVGQFRPKFEVEEVVYTTDHFCTDAMPYNFVADSVHAKKLL